MSLDLSPLVTAIARLAEGLERYGKDTSDSQIRDGLIQRFEFTYDLSHKMLRRALEAGAANPDAIDRMGFPELIRTAGEQGLLASEWSDWRTWREMRNITSHTYDEAKAVQVVAGSGSPADSLARKARRSFRGIGSCMEGRSGGSPGS